MLNTVGNTRWTFDWLLLHFTLVTEGGQLHRLFSYNHLFANSLRVLKLYHWSVTYPHNFKLLDLLTHSPSNQLCNKHTRIVLKGYTIKENINVPVLRNAAMVSSVSTKQISADSLSKFILQLRHFFANSQEPICL